MVEQCRRTPYIVGLVVFLVVIIVLLVFFSKHNTEQKNRMKTKNPYPKDGPTIHYYPIISKSSVVWHKEGGTDTQFIEYNERNNIFLVKKANILSIKVVLHFEVSKLSRDSIGAACIVLSDGRKKCKVDFFFEGSQGAFHLKEKIYARPGFSFSIRILNQSSAIKSAARNMLAITQSFYSGPDINSTYARIS